ncbi:hypothetical protein CVT25_013252 [Psilocybe cyanescens]|uniref:Acyl-protein thioesterase 1 n=1 Tax=Psilocybe cyanescens TaxID=93625 RepID=A0A409VWS5_PSICY|nr:hypothetical protein CVT25_013252 [Psilocybe cyanescens]
MLYWTIIFGIFAVALYHLAYLQLPSLFGDQFRSSLRQNTPKDQSTMAAALPALKYLTVPAASKHTATVIFVHGLGDTGHGWRPVADMFKVDPGLAHVKWVLPHSANMGMVMPSWYIPLADNDVHAKFDIYSFGLDTEEDEEGMRQSANMINELIRKEISDGIEPDRIVLGGFSQGGTMSLLTGLTGGHKLAGLVVLSGWLPLRNKFKELASPHAAPSSIFWGTGTADPLVKLELATRSSDFLTMELGIPKAKPGETQGLSYNVYPGMIHTTIPEELDAVKTFIKKVIPIS